MNTDLLIQLRRVRQLIRQAQFDNNIAALAVLEPEMDRLLDRMNEEKRRATSKNVAL
jgi:hypothetical protein